MLTKEMIEKFRVNNYQKGIILQRLGLTYSDSPLHKAIKLEMIEKNNHILSVDWDMLQTMAEPFYNPVTNVKCILKGYNIYSRVIKEDSEAIFEKSLEVQNDN